MIDNPILRAIDNPEEAAYTATRRQARRRLLMAILAIVGVVIFAVGWKVVRHSMATSWLQANQYQVVWEADGKSWRTAGSTSVKYVAGWSLRNNAQSVGDLTRLAMLYRLEELDLSGAHSLTDADLEVLERLTALRTLNLDRTIRRAWLEATDTHLTNATLARVKSLKNLKEINLSGQAITDEGLVNLSGMDQLQQLELNETGITDNAFDQLKGLPNLKTLSVFGTKVTMEGVRKFQGSHPGVKVVSDVDILPAQP